MPVVDFISRLRSLAVGTPGADLPHGEREREGGREGRRERMKEEGSLNKISFPAPLCR